MHISWADLAVIAWALGAGLWWLPCARWVHRDGVLGATGRAPTQADLVASVLLGMSLACLWPLFIPGWAVYARLTKERQR